MPYFSLFLFFVSFLQTTEFIEFKQDSSGIKYYALYRLKEYRNKSVGPHRILWAHEEILNRSLSYRAHGDKSWQSADGNKFEEYSHQDLFKILELKYTKLNHEANEKLIKQYLANQY